MKPSITKLLIAALEEVKVSELQDQCKAHAPLSEVDQPTVAIENVLLYSLARMLGMQELIDKQLTCLINYSIITFV